ncbi:CASP-like protein 5B1 [Hibiscus syriacus]|uniref:CASP-like protein n=1 Tax=Hibiscus syriacus TaxID=106335 RepID=A0A6A2Z785_HIBSY|nr:CASP-like protein 5B1 [Hibiscus syriacus]
MTYRLEKNKSFSFSSLHTENSRDPVVSFSLVRQTIIFSGTTVDDLFPLFDKYEKVVDIFIPKDRRTGDSCGFAFVRYKYADEAQKADSGYPALSLKEEDESVYWKSKDDEWVTTMLSLAATCSSAGVIVMYARDLDFCRAQSHLPCSQFEISIILAFITWILVAMSSHVMFWILASF